MTSKVKKMKLRDMTYKEIANDVFVMTRHYIRWYSNKAKYFINDNVIDRANKIRWKAYSFFRNEDKIRLKAELAEKADIQKYRDYLKSLRTIKRIFKAQTDGLEISEDVFRAFWIMTERAWRGSEFHHEERQCMETIGIWADEQLVDFGLKRAKIAPERIIFSYFRK